MSTMESDFDDIFGDLKEDQQFSAVNTSDLDESSIFGDTPVTTKPVEKPSERAATTATPTAGDQDEFLSWLDDGDSAPSSSAPPPAPMEVPPAPSTSNLQTVDLGDDDDDDFLASPSASAPAVAPLPPTIAMQVSAVPTKESAAISMDDDDDDDLEKFIEQAKANAKKKSNSRESSGSSLQIKSQQRHESAGQPQFDVATLHKQFLETGAVSTPATRVAMWQHAVLGADSAKETASLSMYAVQTTPLNLPNQEQLRKDVESICSGIFASALHAASVGSTSDDSADASRLLFIDNTEILVSYLCKKLKLSEYPSNLALLFAPAIAASGNDPLRLDLVATLTAVVERALPHLSKQMPLHAVAEGRRPLLKWLLLYHAPTIAFHLDQHFHEWHTTAGIPDSWVVSMFESETYRNGLDFLIKVWDCCLLLSKETISARVAATRAFPSTTMCFVIVHLIARAEKKLMRMEGEQLKACLMQTLVEVLQDKNENLVNGVRKLIDATPQSFCVKLRDAAHVQEQSNDASTSEVADASSGSKSNMMSLLTASTNGVMHVGSMMISMPTNLLTTMVPLKLTSPSSAANKDGHGNEELFTQLMREDRNAASICLTLSASDVIPHVFRSFQAPQNDESIRYFIIDCRASEEVHQGQVPTAFHFDPDAVTDPQVLETVLATLNPMKGTVHMCVMNHGYGYIADSLRQMMSASPSSYSDLPFFLRDEFLEAMARDISRVNAALLFLAKRGFPHVSVLEGGYGATHELLLQSGHEGFCVSDLIDHDAPQCTLCQHLRSLPSTISPTVGKTSSFSVNGSGSASSSRGNSSSTLEAARPKLSSNSGSELDAKSLFDGRGSQTNSYFSGFTGALQKSGKVMMNPADSLKDSKKWFMKKTGSMPSSPDQTGSTLAKSPTVMPNLNKLKNSLSHIGSESLDMLKKAEQATVGKTQLKNMFSAASPTTKSNAGGTGAAPNVSPSSGGASARSSSFQKADEEVFTIDDDEEEEQDDFVGGGGSSRTSSSSSMGGRTMDSFSTSVDHLHGAVGTTLVLHTVEKGKISELSKGQRVSRSQMQPFVDSPFFAAYKKKKAPATATAATSSRASMLPRRLVVAENHVIVLKAERHMEDVYVVKSCHYLAHLARMTCLKKNALMVTVYYTWKDTTGVVQEKRNAYEVQQRDEFIKVIKTTMEKM
ncbi:hypothetical protein Poli38472_000778 [Pythium oligandrum]|uniref:Rhodanese domain-containing protein n=1 Tax=Pythium oligandrum TaxID=41045 RepID=A0A8K1FFN4_PYTOL|nr:hypothetical protein Poli38472_000778 [Pythium oligandrum]|eukprot:TMW60736.1 hypothetical protein Poli38472_000778 [Pythium oligandrum]